MMRVVVAVIAGLTTLGVAAFGVVVAQQAAGPSSLIALAAHSISPGQAGEAAPSDSTGAGTLGCRRPGNGRPRVPLRSRSTCSLFAEISHALLVLREDPL